MGCLRFARNVDWQRLFSTRPYMSLSLSQFARSLNTETAFDVLAVAKRLKAAGKDIVAWLAEGKLKARIDRVLPLSETAQAHRLQEESTIQKSGALAGKIVLKP